MSAPERSSSEPHSPAGPSRRQFMQRGAVVASAAALAPSALSAQETAPRRDGRTLGAGERVRVAVMGVNGRGTALAQAFAKASGSEVAAVCDVDQRAMEKAAAAVEGAQERKPKLEGDFRRVLDDPSVDALVIAAPNHWHAPATILGCNAGKHVYVEKPCSYTAEEGELAVAAARQHRRVVTMGNQRRSWPAIQEAIAKVHEGEIGPVHYARTWYNNRRGSIGRGNQTEIPAWLDWNLWQGPAPRRDFQDNLVHYNWHWMWHWGNGELGNNGVHAIDVARWGLGVTYPQRVMAGGGRYRWEDDQETPDTMMVTYDFPEKKTITWEGLSWSPLGANQSMFGVSFHGEQGSIVIDGGGYKVLDLHNKEVGGRSDRGGDEDHVADFLDAIRTGRQPNSDIEGAHQSTLLCHLGNIAYRANRVLNTRPSDGHIEGDADAQQLWGREYEKGWEPQVA